MRLITDDDQLAGLQSDYDAMRRARIVGAGAPDFDSLIDRIRDVAIQANRWT